MRYHVLAAVGSFACVALSAQSWAFEQNLVTARVAEIGDLRTVSGATLKNVTIGWESYGTLNGDKSNAILIVPFFSGGPHAAGKYSVDDAAPGYWDNIIGSGLPIDTDKYFVVSVDALCNMNKGPANRTTGPASVNPDTGKPYGSGFPVLTFEDFVAAQKAVIDSLGIARLEAVVGYSMGAGQALQWAVSHPDMIERAVLVTPWAMANGWNIAKMHVWSAPIRRDPNFNGGDYYDGTPPIAGLNMAAEIALMDANGFGFLNDTLGRAPAVAGTDPIKDPGARYGAEKWLIETAAGFASVIDANGWLCQAGAIKHFDPSGTASIAEVADRVRAKMLLLPAASDNILPEAGAVQLHEALVSAGKDSTLTMIAGNMGHFNGWYLMPGIGDELASFLAR